MKLPIRLLPKGYALNSIFMCRVDGAEYYVVITKLPIGSFLTLDEYGHTFNLLKAYNITDDTGTLCGVVFKVPGQTIKYGSNYLMVSTSSFKDYSYTDILAAKIPLKFKYTFELFNYFDYLGLCTLITLTPDIELSSKF